MTETVVTANTAIWKPDGYYGPLVPVEYTLRETFRTQDSALTRHIGKPFTLVRVIDQVDDDHDEEVLPMFVIEVEGEQFEAFVDEIAVLQAASA